jgi:hypothetical protein
MNCDPEKREDNDACEVVETDMTREAKMANLLL